MFSFLVKTDGSHLHKIYAKTDLPLASKYLSKLSVTRVVTHFILSHSLLISQV